MVLWRITHSFTIITEGKLCFSTLQILLLLRGTRFHQLFPRKNSRSAAASSAWGLLDRCCCQEVNFGETQPCISWDREVAAGRSCHACRRSWSQSSFEAQKSRVFLKLIHICNCLHSHHLSHLGRWCWGARTTQRSLQAVFLREGQFGHSDVWQNHCLWRASVVQQELNLLQYHCHTRYNSHCCWRTHLLSPKSPEAWGCHPFCAVHKRDHSFPC